MSHYRNLGGGKRDANEPQIMKRFKRHGWHAEQISGNRLWDLTVFPPESKRSWFMGMCTSGLVDVKQPDGEVTKAQKEKWTDLHALGIPVYVVRTEADVDALVGGTLDPWKKPAVTIPTVRVLPRKGNAAKARDSMPTLLGSTMGVKEAKALLRNYTPPRSTPVAHRSDCEQVYHRDTREPCTCGALDAAKEAEATFAPPEPRRSNVCPDPDTMNGAGDQFPGSDYD